VRSSACVYLNVRTPETPSSCAFFKSVGTAESGADTVIILIGMAACYNSIFGVTTGITINDLLGGI